MDAIKKKIPFNDTGRGEAERLAARLMLMENSRRRWTMVDFWNSTSHLEATL